ncbi:60 kDa neurofilament protein isoform X1 [Patella vulgata]|uniref:60 kDa neurofilament protein isoform X1 n=1 Tax=Patella vulgata TaxID=6465 RepID=UPI002180435D|nr:60 kDa neurofilament protein isoform X1 [Patella vulgata]
MSHSSVTEKRTTITSSSSNYNDEPSSTAYYKSDIKPRATTIHRSSYSPARSGYTRTVEMSSGFMPSAGPGGYANISSSGVKNVQTTRQREKKDMRDLNERFANYIEKVRFLEAQNKKLASELEELKSKWGKETSAIKQMYGAELEEARKLIDDTNKEKSRLELRVSTITEQLDDLIRQFEEAKKWRSQDRDLINKLNQQISELEAEVRMLRRSNESLETERARDKSIIQRLNDELEKLRIAVNEETLGRLEAENRRQTLEEEIEFMKSVHEQELKELAALAYRDTTAENREFWKNELSQAIRDIQNEYDSKVDSIRGDMEAYYNLKVQEYRTGAAKQNMEVSTSREEVKKYSKQLSDSRSRLADLEARNAQLEKQYQDLMAQFDQSEQSHTLEVSELKNELTTLRSEMEGILQELQTLMDAKLSLELEIAAYRKLLEGEENRDETWNTIEGPTQSKEVSGTETSRYSVRGKLNEFYDERGGRGGESGYYEERSGSSSGRGGGGSYEEHHSSSRGGHDDDRSTKSGDDDDSNLGMKMMRGEVSAKTTYQRTQNGPIAIADVNPEGKYIMLENTSTGSNRRDVNLDGYTLKRTVDNDIANPQIFKIRNLVLKPSMSVKVYARSAVGEASQFDLVFKDSEIWRQGAQVKTQLLNENKEEKACHNQKTLYT